jgi:hypothetical protein
MTIQRCEDGFRVGYIRCKSEASHLSMIDGVRLCDKHARIDSLRYPTSFKVVHRLEDLHW